MTKHIFEKESLHAPDPDTEVGLVEEGRKKPERELTLQEKYPEANELELALLGMLDDAMDKADPNFELPLLPVERIAKGLPKNVKSLVAALRTPLVVFVACLCAAAAVVLVDNPVAYAIYPYFVCFVTFVGTMPSLQKQFCEGFSMILFQIDSAVKQTDLEIDAVGERATETLKTVQKGIENAMAPIHEAVADANELEKELREIDPDINIPDTSDVGGKLNNAVNDVLSVLSKVKDTLNLPRHFPKVMQSQPLFEKHYVYPFLAICFLTQLFMTYSETQSNSYLTNSGTTMTGASFMEKLEDQRHLIVLAFKAFLGAVAQILIAFVATQKSILCRLINRKIKKIGNDVEAELKEMIKPVFHDVFFDIMILVKRQLLSVLKDMRILEGLLNEVKAAEEEAEMVKQEAMLVQQSSRNIMKTANKSIKSLSGFHL